MFSNIKPSLSIATNRLFNCQSALQLPLILACTITFSIVFADEVNGQAATVKLAGAPPQTEEKSEDNRPEEVTLETKDKVQLSCTYFPPGKPAEEEASKEGASEDKEAAETEAKPKPDAESAGDGKRTIPYIILHDWESSRADTQALATYLQSQGNAVITPDLRGHGASTRVVGSEQVLDATKFRGNQIGTVVEDIEACKKFLVKKNDAGELNIDMLAVIAIGKTVPIATQWVVNDWSFAPYRKGIKQGQDVKVLIMIAPEKKNGPFAMNRVAGNAIFSGSNALPTIVSWATNNKNAKDSQSIYNRLKKKRPDAKKQTPESKTLFQAPLKDSALSGVQIGSNPKLERLWNYFHRTVSKKINQNLDKLPWQDRSKKQ